jgi:hypothetical protein
MTSVAYLLVWCSVGVLDAVWGTPLISIRRGYRKEEETLVLRPGWGSCRWIGLDTLPGECSTCAPVPTSSSRRAQRPAADHEAGRGRRNHHNKSTLAMLRHTLSPHIPVLLFHARWGKLVCGSWERWSAGRLEPSAPSLRIGPRPISDSRPARHAHRTLRARACRMPVQVV